MSYKRINKHYSYEVLVNGTRDEIGDKIYSYHITSDKTFLEVKKFCMQNVQLCYEKEDKPNIFSPELDTFIKISETGLDIGEMYFYKVRKVHTA